jgi:putative peptidoglycan lipid II flippase
MEARRPPSLTASLSRDSATIAGWTLVSRVSGLGRVIAIAAVLGPTYLGNTFQAVNVLPNLMYEFLTGSLIAPLLIPALVRHTDRDDAEAATRVASAFLGMVVSIFTLVTAAAILAGPLVLRVLSLGVDDPTLAKAQRSVGLALLVMIMPQLVLYGIGGTAGAAMNARGRYALAAAAPALENIGVILTMVFVGVHFGAGVELDEVSTPHLIALGVGTTAAVGLHAAAQWWGARRLGISLLPTAAWRDPDLRRMVRLAVPSAGYAGLSALRAFGLLIAANRVRGGVVALQAALHVFFLPVALGARSVSLALLPRLSRRYQQQDHTGFRDELVGGARLVALMSMPAAVALVGLAYPLARGLGYGEMASPQGVALLAVSLASLGLGVIGESGLVLGTNASYARNEAGPPLTSMLVRAAFALVGIVVAFSLEPGRTTLLVLGLAVSVGNLLGISYLGIHFARRLPLGKERLLRSVLHSSLASVVAIALGRLVVGQVDARLERQVGTVVGLAAGAVFVILAYLAVHAALGTKEIRSLTRQLLRRRQRRVRP